MVIQGSKIRDMRRQRAYSLNDLAAKAGISVSYLSEIERGSKKPSLRTLEKLAQALHITQGQLLDENDAVMQKLSVGDKIRIVRENQAKTMTELASAAGISVSYLSQIERSQVQPAVRTVNNLAKALGVPVSSLVGKGGLLGSKVRQARDEQGLTQAELAQAAGVSPGLIGQVENGRVQPSLQTIEALARVLGSSPCYFITDDAGIQEMLGIMRPEVRELLQQPHVQSVLRLVCDCTELELTFIMEFIKLYKRSAASSVDDANQEP